MNMKISELELGRLGEAGLEKAALGGGIGGSLLLGTELPGAAKQGRARRARRGAMCQSCVTVLRPLTEWSGEA